MKFTNASDQPVSEHVPPKLLKQMNGSIESLVDIKLYPNVAVYLMKPGTKGYFKYIATLANNGEEAASWAIRVFFTNNSWTLQVAAHPDIDPHKIKINIYEILEQGIADDSIKTYGNLHFASMVTPVKLKIENAVNLFIEKLADCKIPGIESASINKKYTFQYSTVKYRINYTPVVVNPFNEKNVAKYNAIIRALKNKPLGENELKFINRISKKLESGKTLIKKEHRLFNEMSQDHLSQNEKIKIAIAFLTE
jgi:hypothetical protein